MWRMNFFYQFVVDAQGQSSHTSTNLPEDPRSTLLLDYQHLEVGPVNTTISWLYHPDSSSPCECVAKYRVRIYRYDDSTDSLSANSLQLLTDFETDNSLQKTVRIPSQYLKNGTNIFRLFALNASNSACEESYYSYNLTFDGELHNFGTVYLIIVRQ